MAHMFGAEVNAEGIEDRDQYTVLSALGCDVGQGYYFAPALEARRVCAVLHGRCRNIGLVTASQRAPLQLDGGPSDGLLMPAAAREPSTIARIGA